MHRIIIPSITFSSQPCTRDADIQPSAVVKKTTRRIVLNTCWWLIG